MKTNLSKKTKLVIALSTLALAVISCGSIGYATWTFNNEASMNANVNGSLGNKWNFNSDVPAKNESNIVIADKKGNEVSGATIQIKNNNNITDINLSNVTTTNNLTVTIPSLYTDSDGVTHTITNCGDGTPVYTYDYFAGFVNSLVIPSTIRKVGDNAFSNAWNSSLKTITFEDGSDSLKLGDKSFYLNTHVTSLVLPSRLKDMGTYCFASMSALSSLDMSQTGLSDISDYAFQGDNLGTISWPSKLKTIGSYAFATNSGSMQLKDFPSSLKTIDDHAFYNNHGLTSLDLSSSSITTIGDYAFLRCYNLTSVTLPTTLTSLGTQAFSVCNNLTTINYLGTMSQWNKITKGSSWYSTYATKYIVCSDGTINL